MEMLAGEFKPQAEAIVQVFAIVDECIELIGKKSDNSEYHRVCGLTLAKARNYAFGSYGLILDGLGQEAGALMRPFIEYHELLVYFRLDPNRVKEAVDHKLPSAGKRAQLIEGYFQEFRQYLNEHASHSSFSDYSLKHMFDYAEMKIRTEQPMLPEVLLRNMADIFIQFLLMAIEAINCLQSSQIGVAEKQAESIMALKEKGIEVFRLEERQPRNRPNQAPQPTQ